MNNIQENISPPYQHLDVKTEIVLIQSLGCAFEWSLQVALQTFLDILEFVSYLVIVKWNWWTMDLE